MKQDQFPATLARRLSIPHESTVCDFRVKAYPSGNCNPLAGWATWDYGTAGKLVVDLRAAGYGAAIFNAAGQAI